MSLDPADFAELVQAAADRGDTRRVAELAARYTTTPEPDPEPAPEAGEQPAAQAGGWEQQAAAERAGGQELLDTMQRQFPDRFAA